MQYQSAINHQRLTRLVFVFVLAMAASLDAKATWSIIAVDREKGEIGIVGASCTFDVSGIASIVPGKGAVVVQAASSYFARMEGVDSMEKGTALNDILTVMTQDKYQPERQQIGLILLDEGSKPLVRSGSEINDWSGEKIGDDFAVMGNILVGEAVLADAFSAFDENRDAPLADRLMKALKAGEQAGGDSRCKDQYARSAFLMIYSPDHESIIKIAVQGIEEGGRPAVTQLDEQVRRWRSQ